jgi:hypothetical protein
MEILKRKNNLNFIGTIFLNDCLKNLFVFFVVIHLLFFNSFLRNFLKKE